jgi:putative PIN family toxin of toxin-antitoxin system
MARDRIVIDTNVLISGMLIATSTPRRAIERALSEAQLVATTETVSELLKKLMSPKFDRYVSRQRRQTLAQQMTAAIELVTVLQPVRACRDPKDDRFLEAAVNGGANVIITGDRDLLQLNPFRGIRIVTPAAYLRR